jgi:hypothetical protein
VTRESPKPYEERTSEKRTGESNPGNVDAAGTDSRGATKNGAFDEFWAQYPRKRSKQAAERAFKRAVKHGTAPQEIIAGAMRYAQERDGQEPKYTKYPATWLNDGCWEDEPSPPARQLQPRNPGVAYLLKIAGGGHE